MGSACLVLVVRPVSGRLRLCFFWLALNEIKGNKSRFWIATLWFGLVQAVQLSWFVAHPYLYIWAVYLFLSLAMGLQFGWLSLFVTPRALEKIWKILALAGFWVLLEWSRLFVLRDFPGIRWVSRYRAPCIRCNSPRLQGSMAFPSG